MRSTMMQCGTTTVEAKTGYDLDLDSEVKMLRAIEKVHEMIVSLIVSLIVERMPCLSELNHRF